MQLDFTKTYSDDMTKRELILVARVTIPTVELRFDEVFFMGKRLTPDWGWWDGETSRAECKSFRSTLEPELAGRQLLAEAMRWFQEETHKLRSDLVSLRESTERVDNYIRSCKTNGVVPIVIRATVGE